MCQILCRKENAGSEETAQSVKLMLHKPEGLNSIPRNDSFLKSGEGRKDKKDNKWVIPLENTPSVCAFLSEFAQKLVLHF